MSVSERPLHLIDLPLKIITGSKAIYSIPSLLRELGYEKPTIFTDSNLYNIIGKKLEESLIDEKFEVKVHIVKDSRFQDIDEARSFISETHSDVILAVGGGKVIDVSKYSSFLEKKRFISVPTAVSHDGIASPAVSLKDDENYPVSRFAKPPIAVVADLDIISKAPHRLIASGFGDIIGKFTSVRDAILARRIRGEYVGDYSLSLALMSAKMVSKNASLIASHNLEGMSILVEAAISCGVAMGIAGSSRPCSGSEHLFSHALDRVYPVKKSLHGEQVGVGTIMMAYLHGLNWRKIRNMLEIVGAPVDHEGLGVPPEAIIEALISAHKIRRRYTILGFTGLSKEAAINLARKTLVIP